MDQNPIWDSMREKMQETPHEARAREKAGFPAVERSLIHVSSGQFGSSLIDNVSSYLGSANPLACDANPAEDRVWLLDSTAYRPVHPYPHSPQPWHARVIVAYFQSHSGKDASKIIADIANKVGLGANGQDVTEATKTIADRLHPFLQQIQPARYVAVKLPDGDTRRLGPGDRDAISTETVTSLGEHKDGDILEVAAVSPILTGYGPMSMYFADPEGWAFISDIDDSIKVTMTASPTGLLSSTFVDTPTPINGMPELYAHIASTFMPAWFYLSASPYNLYPFLRGFLHTHYPFGTIMLRDASWMDLIGFLQSFTQGTKTYKVSRMEKIHEWLPKRKFICLGDTTQSDPEAYGTMARKYPGWIKAIFIRKVTDVSETDETQKNSDERLEKAFRGLPREIWQGFSDPKELYEAVDRLRGS